jgi:dUTP pyrophosphatase
MQIKSTKISVSLTEVGAHVLNAHGLDAASYMPAYDGESVGLDLYNAGPDVKILGRNKWVAFGEEPILVPTGVKIALPSSTVGLIKGRGSIITTGLAIRAGVVDPGFTGEVFVNFVNLGEKDIILPAGCKLPAQLIVLPCFTSFDVVSSLEYLKMTQDASRKTGELGSSDAHRTTGE